VRVMVEGRNRAVAQRWADSIASAVRNAS
jgi:hypothetical protein